jgi:flagellar basal-body rod protein FlgB
MGSHLLIDRTVSLLEQLLDLRMERHTRVASNIANADTPQYKATDIAFEEAFAEVIAANRLPPPVRTHPRHLPAGLQAPMVATPAVVHREHTSIRNDANSVDLDREMTRLIQNHILYNATAQLLSKKFTGLRLAIEGGK